MSIQLQDRDAMAKALRSVADIAHARERLFPALLKHAGEEKEPEGVSLAFELAVFDYFDGLPEAAKLGFAMFRDRIFAAFSRPAA